MVEVLTWLLVGRTATPNLTFALWLFWHFLLFQKYLKEETCTCVTEIPVFFMFSPEHLFLAPAQGRTQAIRYSIFLYSHGQTQAKVFHWEPACTGIFLTYFSLPLPYILSIFISIHPPKIPSAVQNHHAFRVVKMSCEKQKFPCLLCWWKENMRKTYQVYI